VVRQADEYGHSRQRELSYLVTHGLLHLLGYDHEQPEQAQVMRSREEALLGALGITRAA
jgi:probable rRNA maturation factor